jgi:hypothetical protein
VHGVIKFDGLFHPPAEQLNNADAKEAKGKGSNENYVESSAELSDLGRRALPADVP